MQSTKVCLIYLQNKIFRKEVRECRPQLCAIWSRKLTWGREAQTPSDWLRSDNQVMEKNFKADVGSLNRESFCTGLSATPPGGSHWLPSWSFGSCLGSLNCFCNHSVPLTENPTNFQKTVGEEHAGPSYSWEFLRLHPNKTTSWRLTKYSEKDTEGLESHGISSGQREHFFSGFIVG